MKKALKMAEQSIKDLMHALAEGRVTSDDYQPEEIEAFSVLDSIKEALAQPEQGPQDIAALVEGMEVSIDVSTGEYDIGNRLFGTVTLVQENQGSKHGLILLVQDPEPNFKPAPLPEQEPVAHVYFFDHRGRPRIAFDNAKGIKIGDKLYTTPPKRPWAGMTDEEIETMDAGTTSNSSFYAGALWAEAKLKDKNT